MNALSNIIIVGSPGSGKGTYCQALQQFGYHHLGMGDLLRKEIAGGSEWGKAIRDYVDGGKLIPDDLALEIGIQNVRSKIEEGCAFVLEGFPSTVKQFELFVSSLSGMEAKARIIVVHLDCSDETAAVRIASRSICLECASIYNSQTKPPQVENRCDKCHHSLHKRPEDTYETALRRIQNFREKTRPILEVARQYFNVVVVDANRPLVEILKDIASFH